MKKIAKKIALILLIVMLVSGLTGCITHAVLFESGIDWSYGGIFMGILTVSLDIATSPIQLVILIVEIAQHAELKDKAKSMDKIDTFSAETGAISDAQLFKLKEKLNSLPETEIISFTNKTNSFSQTEISAIINDFNNLSGEEINSSIEALISMSDDTLIAVLNNYNY